ncbi:MAG: O-antigen ligase family protein [Acidobacteria bacterium]|nr:O-antigen ligase family protein [Acidobacteriota bacterium]
MPGRALTIAPAATIEAAAVLALVLLAFWTAREAMGERGSRTVARGVAWTGLAVSLLAIVLRASGTLKIYGFWPTGYDVPPFGPFLNRNHMGTWLVMALPLVVGHVAARVDRIGRERSGAAAIDATTIWLIAAAAVLLAASIVSLSRSTVVGIAAGGLVGSAIALRRRVRGARWLVGGAILIAAAITLSIPMTVQLADRFEQSGATATWDRPQIWRETLPIIRDFKWTGTGLGGYSTAMLVYQQSDRTIFFNQAHDQYLQIAAEGGLLLVVPLLAAAAAFGAAARRRLAADASPLLWMRVGALAGIAGVLVQSIWDVGLQMPASGMLFAVLCGIVVHERNGGAARESSA